MLALPLTKERWGLVWLVHRERKWSTVFAMGTLSKKVPTPASALRAKYVPQVDGDLFLPGAPPISKFSINKPFGPDAVLVTTRELTELDRVWGSQAIGSMICGDFASLKEELRTLWELVDHAPAPEEVRAAKPRGSLAAMTKEVLFRDWLEQWPASVVTRARAIFREATLELRSLEAKGTPAQRKRVLKGVVTAFNALDEKAGCIETGEAEQIVERVEELAELVGLSNDDEALTGHRDW